MLSKHHNRWVFTFVFCLQLVAVKSQTMIFDLVQLIDSKKYQEVIAKSDSLLSLELPDASKARIYQLRADAFYYLNDIEASLDDYLLAIEFGEMDNSTPLSLIMECYSHAGWCYRELGILTKAVSYYSVALRHAQHLEDSVEIATQMSNLALLNSRLGDFEKGLEFLYEAYKIDVARSDTSALGFDLRNLAEIKMEMGDNIGAIQDLHESLNFLSASSGNRNSFAIRLGNIGEAFLRIGQLDSARYYLQNSHHELIKLGDSVNAIVKWIDLARVALENDEIENARSLAGNARNYFSRLEDNQYLVYANLVLISVYFEQGLHNNALGLVNETIKICREQGYLSELKDCYYLQTQLLEKQNRYTEALNSFKIYQVLEDSLITISSRNMLARMETRYEIDNIEKQNEILRLENEISAQKMAAQQARLNWVIAGLILLIIASFVITSILISRHKLKKRLLEAEISDLRNQIRIVFEGDTQSLELDKPSFNASLRQPLTDREFEILSLAITNKSNNEIAESIFVSVNTVKFHLKKIYEKLGVSNRKEALRHIISQP